MFKVSVMYPNQPDAWFDLTYYLETHMPLVKRSLGEGCSYYTVDKGLPNGDPEAPPAFIAACHVYTNSLELYRAGIKQNGAAIFADAPNYTNVKPIINASEVVVG